MIVDVYISKKPQEFEEVIIYPIKSLQDIKAERERLSMRETRTVTGVNVLQSPITALYERFSKKAQSKQLVAKMEFQDNQEKVLKELLRAYVSYDVVYLNEEHFESFIYFLNMDEYFLRTASDYELIVYIKDKLEHFKALHPEYF
jgi:F0F1-type ATP synthase gamma subunit